MKPNIISIAEPRNMTCATMKTSSVEAGSHQPVLVREVLMDIFFERVEPLEVEWSPYNFAWEAVPY